MHLMVWLDQKILVQIFDSNLRVQEIVLLPLGFWGGGISLMHASFSGMGVIPFPETICPKYWICFFRKLHLTSFSFKSASQFHEQFP